MNNILEQILEKTATDLSKRKREISFKDLESMELFDKERLNFKKALNKKNGISIIAEVKKASPSKGIIRTDFDPLSIAGEYINNGASAISVLTDEPFFQGSLTYLEKISKISSVPILRKDFIIDPFQIKEARAFGADAVLLIATMYSGTQLSELLSAVNEYGLQALVECYHENEFHALDWEQVEVVGVNNRNLSTFNVDLHRGVSILSRAPEDVVRVSESGLRRPEELLFLWENGIHSALIGEYFMRQGHIGEAVKNLISGFEAMK
tara:strand:+ start:529 stop:1326 length:798 start_codon:yes stop_codon:yes gene_type:complete